MHGTYTYDLKTLPSDLTHFYNYIKDVLVDVERVSINNKQIKIIFPYRINYRDKEILDELVLAYERLLR